MKGVLAVAALVLVAAAVTDQTSPDVPPAPAGPAPVAVDGPQPGAPGLVLDGDGLPPRIDYPGDLAYDCDGPRVTRVEPDEAAARVAAERRCLRLDLMLGRAEWPDGVTP